MKLFEKIPDKDILDRLRSWCRDKHIYEQMQMRIADKNVCTSCGHYGKIQIHNKKGCLKCSTTIGCKSDLYKDEYTSIKNELAIRAKALTDPLFPNETLIAEFKKRKDNVSQLDLKWKRPDIKSFVVI